MRAYDEVHAVTKDCNFEIFYIVIVLFCHVSSIFLKNICIFLSEEGTNVVGQDRCGTVFYHIHSNFLWKKLLLVKYLYIRGSYFLN